MDNSRPSSFPPIALPLFSAALFALSASSALALPPADGSKCSSNWVNNPAAMACFTQGEEESHAGVKHPHYVACTAAGEIFCCVDMDNGGQNCEAVMTTGGGGHTTHASLIQAILAAQNAHLKAVGQPAPPRTSTTFTASPVKKQ